MNYCSPNLLSLVGMAWPVELRVWPVLALDALGVALASFLGARGVEGLSCSLASQFPCSVFWFDS